MSVSYPFDVSSGGTRLLLAPPGISEARRYGCGRFDGMLWERDGILANERERRGKYSQSSLSTSLRWDDLHNLHMDDFLVSTSTRTSSGN